MQKITVIGGGLAGLTAAISCAEQGAKVELLEAHAELGGRARSMDGPYKANLGPHALLSSNPFWSWLGERDLIPPYSRPPLSGVRFRWRDDIRRVPAVGAAVAALRLRGRAAPVDLDFRTWATDQVGSDAAEALARSAGILTYHHDPGELSAAFVWEPLVRGLLSAPPTARYPTGGWSRIVERLHQHARRVGVDIQTGQRVGTVPPGVVIVATELADARKLLGDESLTWLGGKAVCMDLALAHRRGDPFVVVDLQETGWVERYTAADPSLAPDGEELIQAQMPIRPGETADSAAARLERLLDASYDGWRERETWRRRQVMDGRTGALDEPGKTWRDRPAIDRGDGVFIAGDMVAAPGCLSEIAWASGVQAARLAVGAARGRAPARLAGAA
ncbi:MAG TPA: FAD-dependent oxidoreductase [Solirubrobacteraceae bacterium]|jgi:phytoene dehydrogenase-like protein|nr:FAD-dependent oxidoreductase [Solirubrobacteraceae bacterium]